MKPIPRFAFAGLIALTFAGCGGTAMDGRLATVLAPLLVPAPGDGPPDQQIRSAQEAVRRQATVAGLERLAGAWLAKARQSGDAGGYKLAERCAEAIGIVAPGDTAALLLRGHALHALHRFRDAEQLARQAVQQRGSFLDHGLLGDVLLDQGHLGEALDCYNRMLAIRPGLQGFARAAQVRWLRGDLAGARELLGLAISAGSRRDPEPLAWVRVRLGAIALQEGRPADAEAESAQALELVAGYPPALLLRGRARLARGDAAAAGADVAPAAAACPLPEYLWAHAETLRAASQPEAAAEVEARLRAHGAVEDPRTFAQFLLSRGEQPERALLLLAAELRERKDVFTLAAQALALLRTGDLAGAQAAATQALAEGTREPRLLLQAGAVLLAAGDRLRARQVLDGAFAQQLALLPRERTELAQLRATL